MNFREQAIYHEIDVLRMLNTETIKQLIDIRGDYYSAVKESDIELFASELITNLTYPNFNVWDESYSVIMGLPCFITQPNIASVINKIKQMIIDKKDTRIFIKGMCINPTGLIAVTLFIERKN